MFFSFSGEEKFLNKRANSGVEARWNSQQDMLDYILLKTGWKLCVLCLLFFPEMTSTVMCKIYIAIKQKKRSA